MSDGFFVLVTGYCLMVTALALTGAGSVFLGSTRRAADLFFRSMINPTVFLAFLAFFDELLNKTEGLIF